MILTNELINKIVVRDKSEIEEAVKGKGYESLYTSVIKKQGESMKAWQVRIDYDPANNDYPVYIVDDTEELPDIIPHYDNFIFAKEGFLDLLDNMVTRNRQLVAENKEPLYHSPLWDNK